MSVSTLTVLMLLAGGNPALSGETPSPLPVTTAQDDATAPPPVAASTPVPAPAPGTSLPPLTLPVLPMDAPQAAQPHRPDDDAIVVNARPKAPPEDPLQAVNLETYAVTQKADKIIVSPAAKTYSRILPSFFRAGVRHFFSNLNEPIVALNFLLQHKVGKAFETVGRFGVNSTVGVAGLVDVAKKKPFNLPLRRNGFANTMGFYGVKSGPFLFLPLVGPTTVRDLLGLWVDRLVLPVAVGKPFNKVWYGLPATVIQTLDYRVEFDAQLRKFRESADPYAASRAAYLESRKAEIAALHVHRHAKQACSDGLAASDCP